jgi:hypothetical protein
MLRDNKYTRSVRPFILLAFLCFYNSLQSQVKPDNETLKHLNPDESVDLHTIMPVSVFDINQKVSNTLSPSGIFNKDTTSLFYDSLKVKASRTLITRKLYDFLIVSHEPSSKKEISGSSEAGYKMFSGKKIRNIAIKRLSVFGPSVSMPISSNPNRIEKLLNATHINTNEHIIQKNLLFSIGDTLSPLVLSDNERIIRQLPFIDDSRIIVVPVSDDEVDIVVVTKDVYSLGANYKYSSITKGSGSLFDKNIFGMGHEFRINVSYDSDLPDSPALGAEYNINNIARSFTNLGLYYYDGLGKRTYGFNIDRKLVSATTKYAF